MDKFLNKAYNEWKKAQREDLLTTLNRLKKWGFSNKEIVISIESELNY